MATPHLETFSWGSSSIAFLRAAQPSFYGGASMYKRTSSTISLCLRLAALALAAAPAFAQMVANGSYTWSGQVVSFDEQGKTVTVTAACREHINRYIGEFKRGDKMTLNWAT